MSMQRDDTRTRWLIGLGAAVAVVAVVLGVVALTGDDDPEDEPTDQSSSTSSTTSTTAEETTTSTTEAFPPEVGRAVPVFPDPTTARRFESPVALVDSFARDFVGMTTPIVGELAPGDSRSGEVEVRAFAEGEPTTVLVRQLEDDTWFVIGATAASIQPATPTGGASVRSPLELTGSAYAFEGTVGVTLHADGITEPIAEGFVTGRGDGVLGDYRGSLPFDDPGPEVCGTLLYTSEGGEDGAPIAFAATRICFA